jgi:GT2 family glycosyltransferase
MIESLARLGDKAKIAAELSRAAAKVLFSGGPVQLWRQTRTFLKLRDHGGTSGEKPDLRLDTSFLPPDWRRIHPEIRRAMEICGGREIDALRSRGGTIAFPAVERPVVSIVIPLHNKAAYTYYCLRSILANTAGSAYEVVAVDDASGDATAELLALTRNVRVVRHEQNQGFIGACNDGAAQARGAYLCFLNNDTVVTPAWLSHLIGTIAAAPGCGAVVARLVYPEGRLQEAGSIVWRDGSALGYGRGDDPAKPHYGYVRDVSYGSGACLLLERELFQRLGGFDPRYRPAYYEDTDLCFRVREAGRRVLYQPACVVYHLEFSSSSQEKAVQQMKINQAVFTGRWRDRLATQLPVAPENILRARDERAGTRVLVLDDRIPTPPMGSGYPRAYAMAVMLARSGFVTGFFPLRDPEPFQPWLGNLQQLGVEVFFRPYADFRKLLKERRGHYDAVIVSRPHNAAQWLPVIRKAWPDVPVLYDAEALFSTRDVLKAKVQGHELPPSRVRALVAAEMAPLADADAVMTVSAIEQRSFEEFIGDRPAIVWGHPVAIREPRTPFAGRSDLLFVGGFLGTNTPNEMAVTYFIRDVLPLVRARIDCRLIVVGAHAPDSVRRLEGPGVEVLGFVEDLRDRYERHRVFVAPHLVAAGIPLKVLEAMSFGIPCVVSDVIGGQLGLTDGVEALVGRDAAELAAKIVEAHERADVWEQLQRGALDLVQRTCDPELLERRLKEAVDAAIARRRLHQPRRGAGGRS